MRRLLAVTLMGLGLAGSAAAQGVSARVGGELTGFPGSIVLVPVAVDLGATGEKLGSYTARLTWDPARLVACLSQDYYYYSCIDSIRGGNFPRPQMNYDSAAGTLTFTAISPAGAAGLVTLARIPFVLRDTLAAPLTLSFSEISAAVTFTDLLPGLNVTSATMCPARGRWGDVDRDERANSRDALLTLSKVVGLPVDTIVDTLQTNPLVVDTTMYDTGLADVNGDGAVQSVDALIILSYAVGIDIPGQRVLLLAPTSCGTGSARTLAIFPGAAQLVPNQVLGLLLQARDTAGRLVTGSDAIWRSSNYDVATVDGAGVVTPRAPGTATITGELGPGVRATSTITVIPRRTSWIVDARATGAAVQLGTAAFPMDHPTRAFTLVSEGDTIRVAAGTYDFDNTSGQGDVAPFRAGTGPARAYGFDDDVALDVGVVILGGTPGDTTMRPVFRAARYYGVRGLWLRGGTSTLIKNIVLRDMDPALELDGTRNVALEDSRIEIVNTDNYGDGIYSCTDAGIDTLRIDRSVFVGDSSGDAIYFGGCSNGVDARVIVIRDSKILRWSDAVYGYEVDSTAVIRSEISGNDGYGISLRQENVINPALYIAHSRIERNYYEAINAESARRLVVDTSVILAVDDDAIDIDGGCGECGGDTYTQVYLHGDTIDMQADDYNWISSYLGDTLVIDHTVVRFTNAPNFYAYGNVGARWARVTNSQFLNVGSGVQTFYFYGQQFYADSVAMSGCTDPGPGCDQGEGFELYAQGAVLDARVLRSTFSKIGYPVYAGGGSTGFHEASELTIDSAYSAISIGGDSTVVRNNTLSRVWGGILLNGFGTGRGASTVAGNQIACSIPPGENPSDGITISAGLQVHVDSNLVEADCTHGIDIRSARNGTAVRGNTLRGLGEGIEIELTDTIPVLIEGNAISATSTGIGLHTGRALVRRNNIGNGNYYGIYVYSTGYTQLVSDSNAFAGNAQYAIYSASDSVDATNNWWGDAAGPGPLTAGDSVAGARVATFPFLNSAPSGLLAFAPRMFAAAPSPATGTPAPARVTSVTHPRDRSLRPTPAPKRPRVARATHRVPGPSRQAVRRGPS